MEKKQFKFGKYEYIYFLQVQNRKTISLTVFPNLNIVLKVPLNCTTEKINAFLKRKWLWLDNQIEYFKKHKKEIESKEYVSGESFYYLGRQYKLQVNKAKTDFVKLEKGRIVVSTTSGVRDTNYNQNLLTLWFNQRAQEVFDERLNQVLKKFNFDCKPTLVIRKMSKRWGSYLSSKKIILNPALIKASKDCIDYVIAHELCHFKYKNHNKYFYKYQESITPNWKEIKEKLELKFL